MYNAIRPHKACCKLRKTVFFIYHVVEGKIVGGSKLVVANSKLKDLKIEKPLANLDLSKYSKK